MALGYLFSDVNGALNHSGLWAKSMNPEVVHVSFASGIYKQIENLLTVCAQTTERHPWRHDAQRPVTLARAMVFYDVKFDHVTLLDTMLFMEL